MNMRCKLLYLLPAIVLFLSSCDVKIPEDVIAPPKMEQLLYDYHLVQAMSSEYSSADYMEKLFYDYVFKKHNVTKEHFDSSMAWYNRYPKHLQKIYLSLETRLELEVEELNTSGISSGLMVLLDTARIEADSADLWAGPQNMFLSSNHLYSHFTFGFDVPEDSALLPGDSLSLSFNTLFVNEGRDEIKQKAHVAMLLKYTDGSSAAHGIDVTTPGRYAVSFERNADCGISAMSGFVYYSDNDSLSKAKMILSNISLMRYLVKDVDTDEVIFEE